MRRFAGVTASAVAAMALVSACGSAAPAPRGSNSASVDGRSASTGSPSSAASATPTSSGQTIPSKNYIAVCNATSITFYDATSGQMLASINNLQLSTGSLPAPLDADGLFGQFVPTGSPQPGVFDDLFSCTRLSFDESMTKLAGLDSYPGGDTVPATYDLLRQSSNVNTTAQNVVAPGARPTGAFPTQTVTTYVAAAYAPGTDNLWYVKAEGNDNDYPDGYTLIGPNGQTKRYTTPHTPATNATIQFVFGNSVPTFVDDDPASPLSPNDPIETTDAQSYYLSSDGLPPTKYDIGKIRRPDSGKPGGAFIATLDGSAKLFKWDGKSAPVELADVPDAQSLPEVVRWEDES